jgi:hypothetical protein
VPLALSYGPQHVYDRGMEVLGYPVTLSHTDFEDRKVINAFSETINA